MDPIHRLVLDNCTGTIMRGIVSPRLLAGHLRTVFTTSDVEEITAKTTNSGPTVGTQHLLSLLQKRGAKAFPLFIDILRSDDFKHVDLAEVLLNEEKKLRQNSGGPVDPTPVPEESPPPYPYYVSPPYVEVPACDLLRNKASPTEQPISTNQDIQEQTVSTLDTPIRDIRYSTRSKIEQMLEPLDASRHDWRGMASVMGLTNAEVRDLENCGSGRGKMTALFDKMVQTKKTIRDLVRWLRDPDVRRLDAIEELEKTGIHCDSDLNDGLFDEDGHEDHNSGLHLLNTSTAANTSPLSPQQESQDIISGKQDARIPSQVEEHDISKSDNCTLSQAQGGDDVFKANSSIKDARIPSQECGSGDFLSGSYSKEAARFPSQVEQVDSINGFDHEDDNDEVFSSTDEVKKNALLISCVNHKEHNIELYNLEEVLDELGWEVKIETKCKMSKLIPAVEGFLKESERNACCFVYVIGITMNVIGNNYLLPIDLKDVLSRADLIHRAFNINQLVKRLSNTLAQVVIVDGVEENGSVDLSFPGVLSGFAPISPPPNAVISSPCIRGGRRPDKDRLQYIRSVVKHVSEPNISLAEFFDRIGRDASLDEPSHAPVVFSLNMPSFLRFCHTSSNQGLEMPSGKTPCHAIIFANSKYKGANFGITVYKEAENLRMTLLKAGWNCEAVFCDEVWESVMQKLRNTVIQLQDDNLKVVMLYFMGYTQKINDSNFFFGVDYHVRESPPTIFDVHKSVPLQWALDLICEKIYGPKFLIVDDLNKCFNGGLATMTAPQEVLISLPKSSGHGRVADVSFTSSFTKLLEGNRGLSVKEAVVKASFVRHRVNSKLFFA